MVSTVNGLYAPGIEDLWHIVVMSVHVLVQQTLKLVSVEIQIASVVGAYYCQGTATKNNNKIS